MSKVCAARREIVSMVEKLRPDLLSVPHARATLFVRHKAPDHLILEWLVEILHNAQFRREVCGPAHWRYQDYVQNIAERWCGELSGELLVKIDVKDDQATSLPEGLEDMLLGEADKCAAPRAAVGHGAW